MMVSCSHNHDLSRSLKQSFTIFQDSLEKTFRNPYKHTHKLLAVSFVLFTLAIKRSLSRISSPLWVQKCLKNPSIVNMALQQHTAVHNPTYLIVSCHCSWARKHLSEGTQLKEIPHKRLWPLHDGSPKSFVHLWFSLKQICFNNSWIDWLDI